MTARVQEKLQAVDAIARIATRGNTAEILLPCGVDSVRRDFIGWLIERSCRNKDMTEDPI